MDLASETPREESSQLVQASQLELNDSENMSPQSTLYSPESTPELKVPHMLVSVALDEDQSLPDAEAFSRWICAFPALAKHVTVQGVYKSFSTVLVLSVPVVIWNMLPNNPACQLIAYVTSKNLLDFPKGISLDIRAEQNFASTDHSSDTSKTVTFSVEKIAWFEESMSEAETPPRYRPDGEAISNPLHNNNGDTRSIAGLIRRRMSGKRQGTGASTFPQKRSQSIRRLLKEAAERIIALASTSKLSSSPVAKSTVLNFNDTSVGPSQVHSECVMPQEVENHEVHEMPANEPVGIELFAPLSTPLDDEETPIQGWPLALSPLPLLFAMTEMRDEREGSATQHDTFYHP
jgi:hypothetical protein